MQQTTLTTKPVRTLILEIVKEGIATHTSEIVFNVQSIRKNIKEHSVRARLSEAVLKKNLIRLRPGVYDIYREEHINSVVDYPDRGPWGNRQYRGNFSGYLVRDLYYQLRPKSVLDVFEGSGTSRDFFNGLRKKKDIEVSYKGLDLNKGFDILTDPIKRHYDLILAHFPYFNIITYSNHASDLSNTASYEDFISKIHIVMEKIHKALTEDDTIAVVIGDVRKQGAYYPIFNDIINMNIGVLRSVIIKKQNHCKSTGRLYRRSKYLIPIAHEYVLLFSKR